MKEDLKITEETNLLPLFMEWHKKIGEVPIALSSEEIDQVIVKAMQQFPLKNYLENMYLGYRLTNIDLSISECYKRWIEKLPNLYDQWVKKISENGKSIIMEEMIKKFVSVAPSDKFADIIWDRLPNKEGKYHDDKFKKWFFIELVSRLRKYPDNFALFEIGLGLSSDESKKYYKNLLSKLAYKIEKLKIYDDKEDRKAFVNEVIGEILSKFDIKNKEVKKELTKIILSGKFLTLIRRRIIDRSAGEYRKIKAKKRIPYTVELNPVTINKIPAKDRTTFSLDRSMEEKLKFPMTKIEINILKYAIETFETNRETIAKAIGCNVKTVQRTFKKVKENIKL